MPKRITNNTKTDFIVNMTKAGFMRLTFVFLALATVGTGLGCLPYYLKRGTSYLSGGLQESFSISIPNTTALEYLKYATIVLMAFGFFGFLILLISGSKKYFKPKESLPMALLLGYLLMCVVSTFMAYDTNTAVFGSQGRFEGLVSIIAYAGFFAAASQLTNQKLKLYAQLPLSTALWEFSRALNLLLIFSQPFSAETIISRELFHSTSSQTASLPHLTHLLLF